MNNEVIGFLAIDGHDCLTAERGDTRVMTTRAVPGSIQIENILLRWAFVVLDARNCPDLHQREVAAVGVGTVLGRPIEFAADLNRDASTTSEARVHRDRTLRVNGQTPINKVVSKKQFKAAAQRSREDEPCVI